MECHIDFAEVVETGKVVVDWLFLTLVATVGAVLAAFLLATVS